MKARLILSLVVLLGCLAPVATLAAAAPARFPPRDECTRVAGAAAFRAALASAARRRDVAALSALAANDVMLDFGGGAGRAELAKRLRGADGPELWRELNALLALGCAVQDRNLVLPSFNIDDLGEVDAMEVLLVTGARVPLYARPSPSSRQLARLSWQLVKPLLIVPADRPYQHVEVIGSRLSGYIDRSKLRSQMGYRIVTKRVAGKWRIEAFIAGD